MPPWGGRCWDWTDLALAAFFLSSDQKHRRFCLKCSERVSVFYFSWLQPIWAFFFFFSFLTCFWLKGSVDNDSRCFLKCGSGWICWGKSQICACDDWNVWSRGQWCSGSPRIFRGASCWSGLDICQDSLQRMPPFCSGITYLMKCEIISALILFLCSVLPTNLLTSLFPPFFIVGSCASDQSFPASMILIIYCRLCRVKTCIPRFGSAFRSVLCIFDKIIF